MRNTSLSRLVIVLGLCLLGLVIPAIGILAQDPAPVEVRVVPSPIQVASGGEVEFSVEVVEVEGLYGFDVVVEFDPASVQVVDADPLLQGVQVSLGTFLEPGFAVRNMADNEAGRVQFAMTQLNPSEAKSGTGSLIVVKLAASEVDASAELTLEKAQLAQRNGIEIPSDPVSGQIVVGEAPAGPTNTPLPTQPAAAPTPTQGPTSTSAPPTETPEVTAAPPTEPPPPTSTPAPGETAAPQDTPLPASTPVPSPTPVAVATDPGQPAPTAVPTESPAAATATSVPSTPALLPTNTVIPTSLPAPTTVAQAQPGEQEEVPPAEEPAATSNPRLLLIVGILALGLAALAGVAIVALLAGLYFANRGQAKE